MVGAYTGLVIALADALVSWATAGEVSWRTLVLFVVAGIGGWGRKSARTIISGWLLAPAQEAPQADAPPGGDA
jgi:hypothetical protein